MVIFLYGKDTYRSREDLRKMMEKFRKERDPGGYNAVRIDALVEKDPGKIMGELLAVPFLAERRFVAIESLVSSKHTDLQKEVLERVEKGTLPDSNIIVFWEGVDTWKAKGAKALAERLAKEKYSKQFDLLVGPKLMQWIIAEVQARSGRIALPAVQYIVQNAGDDSWLVHSLIDQLVSYAEGREIILKDVEMFLDKKADDNIFTLVDMVVAGRLKEAYTMIREQYRIGKDVQYIFAMLTRQLRILLELRDVVDRNSGMQNAEIARALDLHPFVVQKSLPAANRYTRDQLTKIYRGLLDFDIAIKKGLGDPETLMDIFVAKFSAK